MPELAVSPGSIRLIHGDAAGLLDPLEGSIDLVVTSPPYPKIPRWDELFSRLGATTYPAMHDRLERVWRACFHALVSGGILAINVGDTVRTDGGRFRLWPNHAAVLDRCSGIGFTPLPYILWQKPTNRPNAFLGSGFLPPNAYVTLDCEFILLFRKGELRKFPPHDPTRTLSRYSKAERDRWFSQIWTDIRGTRQEGIERRTGAFPREIPERLIRMFSRIGDTVLDPFAGTGTTLWVAAELGRNAIGVELDPRTFTELERKCRGRSPIKSPRVSPDGAGALRRRRA